MVFLQPLPNYVHTAKNRSFSTIRLLFFCTPDSFWDWLKSFQVATGAVSPWLCFFSNQRLQRFSFSTRGFSVFEIWNVLQLEFTSYRTDAFLQSVGRTHSFLRCFYSMPLDNSSYVYVFYCSFLQHFNLSVCPIYLWNCFYSNNEVSRSSFKIHSHVRHTPEKWTKLFKIKFVKNQKSENLLFYIP